MRIILLITLAASPFYTEYAINLLKQIKNFKPKCLIESLLGNKK